MYKKGNFMLESDFEIREIREEDKNGDVDIFIPIEDRTVNLFLPFIDEKKMSRIQLSEVRSIVLRFNVKEDYNICNIHFLKNIDLMSHLLNFEFDYTDYKVEIIQEEYSVSFKLTK